MAALFGFDSNDDFFNRNLGDEESIDNVERNSTHLSNSYNGEPLLTQEEERNENVDTNSAHPSNSNGIEAPISQEEESNDNVEEIGPQEGMVFESIESLFMAYQQYARLKGFSVVKRAAHKVNKIETKYLVIACDRGRKPKNYEKSTKRIDCPARINAKKMDNGCWQVSKTCSTHNHELEPNMSILMTGHRSISINMKRQLEANDIASLRPCKSVRLLEVQAGGPQNLGCLPKDCRNFIEQRKRLRLGDGDANAIRRLFLRMQQKDRDFFHLMDVDDEGRLCNVLWVHPRSKAAYEEFHDVLSFDTTYLVNRYKMPFATIVGINQHGHSILLGCALVTHEDSRSFKWLFFNWLEAMGNVHRGAILTDQCESIKIAVREVMPNTVHHFCLWHILSKLPQKFKNVANFDKTIIEFKEIVYDSITIEIFERKWDEFVRTHGLEMNGWLKDLFNVRENWAPVYLNHTFWAGMVSTQRSEGMHAYFDGYVHSMSTLTQFVEQYEIAMSNKIQKEFLADFESKNKVIKCISHFVWENQFRRVYTNSIFKLVQSEILWILYCDIIPLTEEESMEAGNIVGIEKYKVNERSIVNNWYHKEFAYTVEYRPNEEYLNYNCKKFESKGVLCCHIFKVMAMKDIVQVNERYLLRRWRKDVHRRHLSIFFAGGYPYMTEEYKKFRQVERCFQECTDLALGRTEKMEFIKQRCIDLKNELLNWNPGMAVQVSSSARSVEQGTPMLNPQVTYSRGKPRSNRLISTNEANRQLGRRSRLSSEGNRGRSNACAGGPTMLRGRRSSAHNNDEVKGGGMAK